MKIKNLTKIFITIAIVLFLATNISNAAGTDMYDKVTDFINGYNTSASQEEQNNYINSFLNQNGLTVEQLTNYINVIKNNSYTSPNTKTKCNSIINGISNYQNNNSNNPQPGNNNQGTGSEASGTIGSFSDWQHQAENFLNKGAQGATIDTQTAITAFVPIGRLLVGSATVILIIVGSIMGVKYMIAGANDKAQMKEKLIYYVISVVLVYGLVEIFTLVVNIMNAILK